MLEKLSLLVVLLPLLAAIIAGTAGYKFGDKFSQLVTTGAVIVACLFSWILFGNVAMTHGHGAPIEADLFSWIDVGSFNVNFGVLVDKLTATMLIVVTTVSACVHVYSWGYMAEDKSKTRFFAYLSFFTFTMLALVTAPNLLQAFMGWEGVGLASYLLIGFWHHKESANAASMKAFVINRIADVGLLLALFTCIAVFGSLDYYDIFGSMAQVQDQAYTFLGYDIGVLELIAFFLFIGAMGKSAQLGFHTWLPDAMEGPTPVSALIHAATMVTAGVFLVARMSPMFELAPGALLIVAWVGGLTAIFAATIGLTQKDIKRVIAYSTCSQLGYMFFACGVSAYGAAMFHLTTHAFFKALLFLGAGAVIHAAHHQQDMFKMGGLRKGLMLVYILMWVGSLALAGIFPFAGFFSKDLILESAFATHNTTGLWLYAIGTLGALLTAFYSWRVIFLTFHGKTNMPKKHFDHLHHVGANMKIPMLILAVGAVVGGFFFHDMAHLDWWNGAIHIAHEVDVHHTPKFFKFLPLVVSISGILLAVLLYLKKPHWPKAMAEGGLDLLYQLSLNKWYVDEFYDFVIAKNIRRLANFSANVFDAGVIDRFGPDGMAKVVRAVGEKLRGTQTGYLYHYAFVFVIGVCLILTWLVF